MRFKNIVLEGPDCSGKSTFYKEFHNDTNYKYNIKDRYMLSMFVYSKYYNRDNIEYWKEELWNDLKKLNTLYIIFLPSWDIIRKRFLKRGDDIQDEESLKKTYDLYSQTVKEDIGNNLPNILVLSPPEDHTVYDSIKEVKDYLKILEEYHGGDLAQDFCKESGKKEIIDLEFKSNYTVKNIMSERTLKNLNYKKRRHKINKLRQIFHSRMNNEIETASRLFEDLRTSNRFSLMEWKYISFSHWLFRDNKVNVSIIFAKANANHDICCFYEIVKALTFDFCKYLKLDDKIEIEINTKIRSSVLEWNIVED